MVQWHQVHSPCCATIATVHLQLSFSQTENLYLLPKTLHYPSLFPGIYNSNLYLYEIDYFRYHTLVESYISVICTWFVSLGMLSSRFVHVLLSELPSFLQLNNILLCALGWPKSSLDFSVLFCGKNQMNIWANPICIFCLFLHLPRDTWVTYTFGQL